MNLVGANDKKPLEKGGESSKIYADNKISSYIDNPKIIGNTTPKEKYDDFMNHGGEYYKLSSGKAGTKDMTCMAI